MAPSKVATVRSGLPLQANRFSSLAEKAGESTEMTQPLAERTKPTSVATDGTIRARPVSIPSSVVLLDGGRRPFVQGPKASRPPM